MSGRENGKVEGDTGGEDKEMDGDDGDNNGESEKDGGRENGENDNNTDEEDDEDEKMLFEAFGIVQSCSLVIDQGTGKSKGFAFVEMPKSGEAKAAIKKLNEQKVGSSKIRVKKAEEKNA